MAYTGSLFTPDIPGLLVIPAHPSNLMRDRNTGEIKPINGPRVIVLHTPEEPVDDVESTPAYFSQPNRSASTHYYADSDGDLIQMVPEKYGAIANGVKGRPYPIGTMSTMNLNYQSVSIEIEGYAAGMHRTCPPGSRQWGTVRSWIISCGLRHNIPITRARVIGHYEVASDRTDPGTLKIDQLVQEAAQYAQILLAAPEQARRVEALYAILKPTLEKRDFAFLHKQLHYIGIV